MIVPMNVRISHMADKPVEREREGIVILDVKGRLVAGEAVGNLRESITQLVAAGKYDAVLNLADVDYIDSSGLGAMVMCFSTMRKSGGKLKLLRLTRRNVELLVLTKLETVFEVFDDEQQAINSFFPNREIRHFDILSFIKQQKSEGNN